MTRRWKTAWPSHKARGNRSRRQRRQVDDDRPAPTTEQMARRLVDLGRASSSILDQPYRPDQEDR